MYQYYVNDDNRAISLKEIGPFIGVWVRMNSCNYGVVGYHVRLTRERSPVRARVVAFLFLSTMSRTYQGIL